MYKSSGAVDVLKDIDDLLFVADITAVAFCEYAVGLGQLPGSPLGSFFLAAGDKNIPALPGKFFGGGIAGTHLGAGDKYCLLHKLTPSLVEMR